MADQILKVTDLGFRVLRRTKAGTTDLVTFDSTTSRNIRAYGFINSSAQGHAHIEFTVPAASCTITTLNDTAINPNQGVGVVLFKIDEFVPYRTQMVMIVTDFVQESAAPDYKFYVNGWTTVQKLPKLQ